MAHNFENNTKTIIRDSLKYVISEKKLTKTRENEPPKMAYGLLQTLFPVIDESIFWTSSDIVLQIQLITGVTEEQVRSIALQPNNFKKVNTALKKNPELTETYPAFILLTDRKVDSLFIGKNCSKLGITLHTINSYQSNDFFALTNGCILQIDDYKKSHLSNTHFANIVNHVFLGKF